MAQVWRLAPSDQAVYKQKLTGGTPDLVKADSYGNIRRGKDKAVYTANLDNTLINSYKIDIFGVSTEDLTKAITIANPITGALPLQVHRVYPKIPEKEQYHVRIVGDKVYELKDHLGNVTVVVSDAKESTTSASAITGSEAKVMSYTHYYAFGMAMPSRSYNSPDYRYGFNGMEKVDEIKGSGNSYDFGARMYDPRIGRWLSVDPLAAQAPGWTPYRAFFNNPNYWVDIDGQIEWPLKGTSAKNKKNLKAGESTANTVIRTSTYREIRNVGTSPHIGIDYRASIGTSFYSLGDGSVTDIGETKSGIKYITVEYAGGDKIRFLHISNVADGIQVGSAVLEGQPLGESGNTGKYKNKSGKMVNYPAHLHLDAVDKDGNKINPEGKNYGDHTNAELFTTYGGDYTKLPENNETTRVPFEPTVAPADNTRVAAKPSMPLVKQKKEGE